MLLFFGGIDMAYKKQKNVNIDALIAREDFEAADETTNTATIFHRKFRRVLKHSQVQLTDCYLIR